VLLAEFVSELFQRERTARAVGDEWDLLNELITANNAGIVGVCFMFHIVIILIADFKHEALVQRAA